MFVKCVDAIVIGAEIKVEFLRPRGRIARESNEDSKLCLKGT